MQKSESLSGEILDLFIYDSDTSCKDAYYVYKEFWSPSIADTATTLILDGRKYLYQEAEEHAMGGNVVEHRFFTTYREKDKKCFIFYLQIIYQYKWDEEKEKRKELDFDVNKELETTYRILSSLKFFQ